MEQERLAQEQRRMVRERREQEAQAKAEQALAANAARTKATEIQSKLIGFYHKLNRKEFDEFMAVCREWRDFAASNKYALEMDGDVRTRIVSIVRGVLSSAQVKKYSAEFGGR
jgi:hypothetical protein